MVVPLELTDLEIQAEVDTFMFAATIQLPVV